MYCEHGISELDCCTFFYFNTIDEFLSLRNKMYSNKHPKYYYIIQVFIQHDILLVIGQVAFVSHEHVFGV